LNRTFDAAVGGLSLRKSQTHEEHDQCVGRDVAQKHSSPLNFLFILRPGQESAAMPELTLVRQNKNAYG
jgi:hypothetical protein